MPYLRIILKGFLDAVVFGVDLIWALLVRGR